MKARLLLSTALATTMALGSMSMALAGTKAKPPAQSSEFPVVPKYTKHVTITWWTWFSDSDQLVKAFEKAYPSIKVNKVQVPSSVEYTKLDASLKAGTGAPDVGQIEYMMLPQFVNTGDIVDITKYDGQYMKYYPKWVQDQVMLQGKLYSMPQDVSPMALIYQPSIFNKYHLSIPKTWAQFAADAAKLHKADPKKYLTYFTPGDAGRIMGLLWQGGAIPFQETSNGAWKINFTSPQAENVINFWGNLLKKGYVKAVSDFTPQWGHELANGTYAVDVGASFGPEYELAPYLPTNDHSWDLAEIPQWNPNHPTDGDWGGASFAVTNQSKNPDAAALFVAWIADSPQALAINNQAGGLFMSPNNAKYAPGFYASTPSLLKGMSENRFFQTQVTLVNKSFQWSPWTEYTFGQMNTEFTKAANGQETWDQALVNIQHNVVQFAKMQGYTVVQ